jgi:hypothetical protein
VKSDLILIRVLENLTKVVEQYFSILDDYFRDAHKIASKNRFVKDNYWGKILEIYDPVSASAIMDSLYDDLRKIDWGAQEQHIQNTGGLKASYAGSMYGYLQDIPQTERFLKKTALYADTIILNDSILSELWSWQKKGRTGWEISFPIALISAIDFLYLKELFISDVDTPVCSLAPALAWSLDKENRLNTADDIVHQTEASIGSRVFGKKFSSYEELTMFLSKIASPELFFSLAKDMSALGDPTGANLSLEDFQKFKSYFETKYRRPFDDEEIYGSLLRSNFSGLIYELAYNGKFKSVMSMDFKGVWKSLIWLMQNSNMRLSKVVKEKVAARDSVLLQALQEENIRWLGNIPLHQIKELRERGELQELRDLLGENIETIEGATDEEFFEVGQQVKYNIERALKKHSSEVQDLNEEYRKKYKLGTSSLIVSGALAITASILPPIALIASILGGTSVYDIIKNYTEKREKIKELQRKPVAMLFDVRAVG